MPTPNRLENTLQYISTVHGLFTCSEADYVTLMNWFRFGQSQIDWAYVIDLLDRLTGNDYRDIDSIAGLLIVLGDIGYAEILRDEGIM